jgi:hypothetical protein
MMGVLFSLYGGNLEGANSGLTNNEELAWDLTHQQASASYEWHCGSLVGFLFRYTE